MIPLQLQIILIIFGLGLFVFLINNIRKYKLELKYTLLWILLNVITLILALFPKVLFFIANNIFIETPVNALYLISFILVFLIIYNLTVNISKLSNQNKKLTQEIGLLKHEFSHLIEQGKLNRNDKEYSNDK